MKVGSKRRTRNASTTATRASEGGEAARALLPEHTSGRLLGGCPAKRHALSIALAGALGSDEARSSPPLSAGTRAAISDRAMTFYVDTDAWRSQILAQAREAQSQGLAGLQVVGRD